MTIDDVRNALARSFGEPTTYDREGDFYSWWPRGGIDSLQLLREGDDIAIVAQRRGVAEQSTGVARAAWPLTPWTDRHWSHDGPAQPVSIADTIAAAAAHLRWARLDGAKVPARDGGGTLGG